LRYRQEHHTLAGAEILVGAMPQLFTQVHIINILFNVIQFISDDKFIPDDMAHKTHRRYTEIDSDTIKHRKIQ